MEYFMQSEILEDKLIEILDSHFGQAVNDFVVKESSDIPALQLVIEMSLYNYFVVRAFVEKRTISLSILQSGFQFKLFSISMIDESIDSIPAKLEEEVRLRIPDKYLTAKGWT